MYDLFLELIRVAIGTSDGLARIPSKEEWRELHDMAKKQSLVGICVYAIQRMGGNSQEGWKRMGIDQLFYVSWLGQAALIERKNREIDRQCKELQQRLEADGFRSCILKGQGIAQLYEEKLRLLRQSGDIDIWVDGTWEEVMDYVNRRTPNREFDMKHTHLQVFENTIVEVHWRPSASTNPIMNRKLSTYFDSQRERQMQNRIEVSDGLDICAPTSDFQLIHVMLHLFGHFLYEGVGMRQMMDLYFAQIACMKSAHGHQQALNTLKKLGMNRFVGATQYVLQEALGLSKDQLLCEVDPKAGKELLREILLGGNFGHHSRDNMVNNESYGQRMMRRLRRRLRLIKFNPIGFLFAPIGKVKTMMWKRKIIKKYNL